jgi:hypothetical protein
MRNAFEAPAVQYVARRRAKLFNPTPSSVTPFGFFNAISMASDV